MTRHPVVAPRRRFAAVRHCGVTRRSGPRSRLSALVAGALLLFAITACGSDDDDGSAGSAPMMTPTLGDRCTAECTTGLVCSASGPFRRQCSAFCSGVDSCSMLAPSKMTVCVSECGLRCTGNGDCPTGTVCGPVSGQMACVSAP